MIKKFSTKGQILLITLLIMVVGLTVGLYMVNRTTTDVALTTKMTDSTRAFNAAEIGIEKALVPGSTLVLNSPIPVSSGISYILQNSDLGTSLIYVAPNNPINSGDEFTVWFVCHNNTTGVIDENCSSKYNKANIQVCYKVTSDPSSNPDVLTPAIGVTIFYRKNASSPIYTSFTGFDSRSRNNGFNSSSTSTTCGAYYNYQANLSFDSTTFGTNFSASAQNFMIAINIKPLYRPAFIAVVPVSSLPKQGNDINSSGKIGDITRKINVKFPYLVPVPWINYTIYDRSVGTLGH
jgi:Tfp pilus assembly protein PilX